MASFLEMFLKNHLQRKHTKCFTRRANHFPSLRDMSCIVRCEMVLTLSFERRVRVFPA